MSLCNREASVVRLSVCKLLHASRYFYHTRLDRHQTCTRLSPLEPASRMCSRSRSSSKVTWYGRFCDVTKCLLYTIQYLLTFCLYMHSLYEAPLRSPSSYISVRQLHVLSTSWNELLRHWRSGRRRWFWWSSFIIQHPSWIIHHSLSVINPHHQINVLSSFSSRLIINFTYSSLFTTR